MSRSYREPWWVDSYGSPSKSYWKNQANRRVRKAREVPDHRAYRKFYEQYDICDYKFKQEPDSDSSWLPFWQVGRK